MGTKKQLAEIIGEEEAERICRQAETKSKELEEAGVKFKEVSALSGESLEALAASLAEALDPTIQMMKGAIFDLHERLEEVERPIEQKILEQIARQSKRVVRRTTRQKGDGAQRTPTGETPEQTTARLKTFWDGFGAGSGGEKDLGE